MKTTNEPCPRCVSNGADRHGDNLVRYNDGGFHCFSCGYHRSGSFKPKEVDAHENKAVLPADFTREVPARAWGWLLQYGLGWKYWKPHVGWSEKDSRLVFTIGQPTAFSIGRYVPLEGRPRAGEFTKWKLYGDKQSYVPVIGQPGPSIVLVEDIISAHKVGETTQCIPLFGTSVMDKVLPKLRQLGKPVVLWLDRDQDMMMPRRAARLSILTGLPVHYTSTLLDPKSLSTIQIARQIGMIGVTADVSP